MANLHQQILALFEEYDTYVREIVQDVLEIELENIHYERPRVKDPILDVLDRVARLRLERETDEN